MGRLVDGEWVDQWYDTKSTGGRFKRSESRFREHISAAPDARFPAIAGRYRLYVSLACPWAHRTLIMRALKGLGDMIPLSVVHWRMLENGWTFEEGPGVIADPVINARFLHQLYTRADPHYTGRVTVPVLWDCEENTIVSNESADIIRMLNTAFDAIGARAGDYYPEALREDIDALNARIYDNVNNGVYKAGFATTQEAYEEAVFPLFAMLDELEARLSAHRWLVGDRFTEADIRLFTTLIRFDAVYVGHFKCNLRRIADYPALSGWMREICQMPAVAETVDFLHIKSHYYESHETINPTGIVPAGPVLALDSPHGRDGLEEAAAPGHA